MENREREREISFKGSYFKHNFFTVVTLREKEKERMKEREICSLKQLLMYIERDRKKRLLEFWLDYIIYLCPKKMREKERERDLRQVSLIGVQWGLYIRNYASAKSAKRKVFFFKTILHIMKNIPPYVNILYNILL